MAGRNTELLMQLLDLDRVEVKHESLIQCKHLQIKSGGKSDGGRKGKVQVNGLKTDGGDGAFLYTYSWTSVSSSTVT